MQAALTQRPSLLRGGRSSARRSLLVRAEGPKVVREYREDDGKMVVPKKDGALYVDGEGPPRVRVRGSAGAPAASHCAPTHAGLLPARRTAGGARGASPPRLLARARC